jgi:hypothetical protein
MRIAACAALISRSVVLPSQGHASAEAICRHRYFLANNFIDVSLDSASGSQSNGLSYLPNLGSCIAIVDAVDYLYCCHFSHLWMSRTNVAFHLQIPILSFRPPELGKTSKIAFRAIFVTQCGQ